MKMRNKFIIAACCLCMAFISKAQEYTIYNQYHFHYYLLNPALAGAEPCTHFMLTHKQQWIGLKDAPNTQILSFQTRTKANVGIGGYLFNDKNGYSYQQGGQLTAAYHIPMSRGNRYSRKQSLDRQLSFGVSVKFYRYQLDQDVVDYANLDGENIQRKDGTYPNANFGIFYQSYKFFTGVSVTNLVPVDIDMFGETEPQRPFSTMLQMGYAFDGGRDLQLEPSVVFKMDENSRKQMDLAFRVIQHLDADDVSWWAGVIMKQNLDEGSGQSLVLLPNATVRIGKFRVGYAFNLDLNKMISQNYGTHEIMIGYSFCKARRFCR